MYAKPQRQSEEGNPHEGQEPNPPEGGKDVVTIEDCGRTQTPPQTGDPIVKIMNAAGMRHPEASQPHEGKPTSP